MEFVTNISKDEYEAFVSNSPNGHFMQSYTFGKIRECKGFIPHYVGLKDEGKLICASLLLEKKLFLGYSYFYAPRGYVIDFHNLELVKAFTKSLKTYAKSNKAIFIKIDPALKLHNLDPDGNIIGDENNFDVIDNLKKLGYKHMGFNLGFEKEEPRFTFRINLDRPWDEIYNGMHPTTRKILNKGNQHNLNIYKGDDKDLDAFYFTMLETAKRDRLYQASLDYYRAFYTLFHKDGLSDIYVVKVNIPSLIQTFENKINSVKDEIANLSDEKHKNKGKAQNKISDLNNQLAKLEKDLDEIKEIKEEELVLSSIITAKYGKTIWTVHGGNSNKLMGLNANYLLYYTIMQDAYNDGYKVFDCFGTCGIANPDKSNPIYGIHSFKKRLGGEYTEFIGEFDFITNKLMYKAYKVLGPIYRKMKS